MPPYATPQTSMFRLHPDRKVCVIIRTSVIRCKTRFSHLTLGILRGPHRLWVIIFPPKNIFKGMGIRLIGRIVGWGWQEEPGCEYLSEVERNELEARVARGEKL